MNFTLDRNLAVRLITGFTAGPIILVLLYLGGLPFWTLLLLAALGATVEFYRMAQLSRLSLVIGLLLTAILLIAGYTGTALVYPITLAMALLNGVLLYGMTRHALLIPGAALYIGVPLSLCMVIRQSPGGLVWAFTIIVTNWGTDSLAYIIDHLFGRHPLSPQLSPHKTIEGAVGGALCGAAIGILLNVSAHMLSLRSAALAGLVAGGTVVGDLFESAIKRRFGAKDASGIIPGHGGILDRIDGLIVACALAWLFLTLSGG